MRFPVPGSGLSDVCVAVSAVATAQRPGTPGLARTVGVLHRPPCQHGAMATIEELLSALDERLLDAIGGKSTPEGVAKLAEARAWLTNPDQPHGSTVTS
jgi:hypothetical protein